MQFVKSGFLALSLVLCLGLIQTQSARAQTCTQDTFEDAAYIICTVSEADPALRLYWKNDAGEPYRYFSRLTDAIDRDGKTLQFAINAGMYDDDYAPVGLYVENGKEQKPVNTSRSKVTKGPVPNFYKKPNGVFYIDRAKAGILPTAQFIKRKPAVQFATQSGPMLVIENKLNPILIKGSADVTRRSGVGVCEGNVVRLAISDTAVNFYDFARLFQQYLKCPNALFLDGGGGAGIYVPAFNRSDWSWHGGHGPMFGYAQ